MQPLTTPADWQNCLNHLMGKTIGFIPTMGALHLGHASLIAQAKHDCDHVIVSLFVNPTQFNQASDFQHYPRPVETDLALLKTLNVDTVFMPTPECIYPHDESFSIHTNHIEMQRFEGEHRPGHFNGVLTVVLKLLQLIHPTHVYFGEKDFQQSQLIKALINAFFLPVECIVCPIAREASGMPYSSRNARLSADEKALAISAYDVLKKITPDNLSVIRQQLLALGVSIDYLEYTEGRFFVAIKIGDIRLIDNFIDANVLTMVPAE